MCSLLDPPPLARPAAVVRHRCDVADALDGEAGRLKRTDGRFASGAWPLYQHVDLTQAVLHGLLGGALGSLRGRERRRLARALKADVPGAACGNNVPVRVG